MLLYYIWHPVVTVYSSCYGKGVITVGIAVTRNNGLTLADALTDYSFIIARDGDPNGDRIARCLTGLGPTSTSDGANGMLGGLYFNNSMMPNGGEHEPCASDVIIVKPGASIAGVNNIDQCEPFSTSVEGIYTCTMINSSMMNQSVTFGIYFNGRSESLDLHISSLSNRSSLYTGAPIIDTPSPSTITVTIGSSYTLSCTSRGSPPDTFTWKKDNDPTVLQSTSITEVEYTSTSAVFCADYSIDSVTASDNGTYTCTVTNPIGSNSTTITVIISKSMIYICIVKDMKYWI